MYLRLTLGSSWMSISPNKATRSALIPVCPALTDASPVLNISSKNGMNRGIPAMVNIAIKILKKMLNPSQSL